jgi:hypothetical protein
MAVFENSIVIAAPVEAVFDYVVDRTKELEWNPDCKFVEQTTPGPVGQGTTWRAQWKGGPVVDGAVMVYDRPRVATSGNKGPLEVTSTFACVPVPEGTRLDSRMEVVAHGPMKLMLPMFARKFRKDGPIRLGQIKSRLETAQ